MTNPLLALDFIFQRTQMYRELSASLAVIHELMASVVDERIEALKQQGKLATQLESLLVAQPEEEGIRKQRRTLLDTLLTTEIEGRKLTRGEICDEVNTFVFAVSIWRREIREIVNFFLIGRRHDRSCNVFCALQSW